MTDFSFNDSAQWSVWKAFWDQDNDYTIKNIKIYVQRDGYYVKDDSGALVPHASPHDLITESVSFVAAEDGVQVVSSTIEAPCRPRRDDSPWSFYSGVLSTGDEFVVNYIIPSDTFYYYSPNGTDCANGIVGSVNLGEDDISGFREAAKAYGKQGELPPETTYYGRTGQLYAKGYGNIVGQSYVDDVGLGGLAPWAVLCIVVGIVVVVVGAIAGIAFVACRRQKSVEEEV